MFRLITASAAVLAMTAQPAFAEAPKVERDLILSLAGACTAETAFGRSLGEVWTGNSTYRLANEAPLRSQVRLETTKRSQQIYDVTALVSFEQFDEPIETLEIWAYDLLTEIEAAVEEEGRLKQVESEDPDTLAWAAPDSDVVMELSMAGRVGVYVTCVDASLKALNLDEALGRTRVGKPTPPTLALPPRPAKGACADPTAAAALSGSFEDAAMAALDYGNAGSRYSEHLAEWIGQQLVDKGVWSEQRKSAFALSALEDPVIMAELEAQMPRAMTMMEAMMGFAEARDAGDEAAACAAALSGLGTVYDIVASNERQWARMHSRYAAEAARLGVTLDE